MLWTAGVFSSATMFSPWARRAAGSPSPWGGRIVGGARPRRWVSESSEAWCSWVWAIGGLSPSAGWAVHLPRSVELRVLHHIHPPDGGRRAVDRRHFPSSG